MPAPWGVLSHGGGRVTLHLAGSAAPRDFATPAEAAAKSGVDPARLIELAAEPDADVPASILPRTLGALGALRQRAPLGILPAAARVLIAGALAGDEDREGILCLPDNREGILCLPDRGMTHWIHVSAREIVSFQCAATGLLAAAFGEAADTVDPDAVGDTMARPERLAVHLASAHAAGDGAALLGHLIGAELAAMRPYWLGQHVEIVGAAGPYREALAAQGVQAETVPRPEAWRAGIEALGRVRGLTE